VGSGVIWEMCGAASYGAIDVTSPMIVPSTTSDREFFLSFSFHARPYYLYFL